MHPLNPLLPHQAYRFGPGIYFSYRKLILTLIKESVMLHFIFVSTARYNKS